MTWTRRRSGLRRCGTRVSSVAAGMPTYPAASCPHVHPCRPPYVHFPFTRRAAEYASTKCVDARLGGVGGYPSSLLSLSPTPRPTHTHVAGNPCNKHLLDLGKLVKKGVEDADLVGLQFNTIGVSDGNNDNDPASTHPPSPRPKKKKEKKGGKKGLRAHLHHSTPTTSIPRGTRSDRPRSTPAG